MSAELEVGVEPRLGELLFLADALSTANFKITTTVFSPSNIALQQQQQQQEH
jgi:hypothetical protein